MEPLVDNIYVGYRKAWYIQDWKYRLKKYSVR